MSQSQDVEELDLEPIAYKVYRDEGWTIERTDEVERKYRIFLKTVRELASPGSVGPTREIDIFWHHHILDTQKYAEDCQNYFGYFLHHYPYSGIFSEEDAAAQKGRVGKLVTIVNASKWQLEVPK